MADPTVKVKSKAKSKKSKKVNKKDEWNIWTIVGVATAAVAAAAAGAYYLLSGETTAVPSKTRKSADAI